MKSEKQKMLDGEIYFANDKELISERLFAKKEDIIFVPPPTDTSKTVEKN